MPMLEDDRASRPDSENPEWTATEFQTARPALELVAQHFGTPIAAKLRRPRGRPIKENKKISQNIRLDEDVLAAYKNEGKGWQTRINQVLRDHMPGAQRA